MTTPNSSGTLDLITGPMFSGKSTELLRRLFTEVTLGVKILYINHCDDTRAGDQSPFSTHNPLYQTTYIPQKGVSYATAKNLEDLDNEYIEQFSVIGIDEGQFFDNLYKVVIDWVENKAKHIIVAGLTSDYQRNKFGSILDLEPISDSFTKLKSFCYGCAPNRVLAPFTWRDSECSDVKEIGGKDKYVPLCRACYQAFAVSS